jgi:hypothetical protein
MNPCEFLSLLYCGNPSTINQLFCFLADDPLHEETARFIVDSLQFLYIEELVIRELTVQFQSVPVQFCPSSSSGSPTPVMISSIISFCFLRILSALGSTRKVLVISVSSNSSSLARLLSFGERIISCAGEGKALRSSKTSSIRSSLGSYWKTTGAVFSPLELGLNVSLCCRACLEYVRAIKERSCRILSALERG